MLGLVDLELPWKGIFLAEDKINDESIITVDGQDYDISALSGEVKLQLDNILFVDQQILQKNNELQISDSARIVYASVLKADIRLANSQG